jgi:hypothetical protein
MYNKFQFGTVTAGVQPAQFQYTPMGLEAFAAPLAAKQAQYDKTFDAIEDADFTIENLGGHDEASAGKLKGELDEIKTQLLENLDKTGNYRDAARVLKKLNNFYNKDEEVVGIRTQRANWKAADEEARKRIDGKTYTQDDYEKWAYKRLKEYQESGGYSYDRSTGQHNTVNTDLRGANLEDEIMDLVYKAGKDAPFQIMEDFGSFGNLDAETKMLLSTTYKEKGLEQMQGELERFLKQSDRYQNYIEEKADYDWFWESRHALDAGNSKEQVGESIAGQTLENLQASADFYKQQIDDPNTPKENKEAYQKIYEGLTEKDEGDIDQYKKKFEEAVLNGTLFELGEATYKHNKWNDWRISVSGAAADIFDTKQITQDMKTWEDTGAKARKEKLDKIDGMNVAQVTGTAKQGTDQRAGGGTGEIGATGTEEFNLGQLQYAQENLAKDLDIPLKEGVEVDAMGLFTSTIEEGNPAHQELQEETSLVYKDAQDMHSLSKRIDKWDAELGSMAKEIVELSSKGNTGTAEERTERRTKLKELNEDILEAKTSQYAEFYYLENLFTNASNEAGGEWIKDYMVNGTISDLQGIFNEANERLTQDIVNATDLARKTGNTAWTQQQNPDGTVEWVRGEAPLPSETTQEVGNTGIVPIDIPSTIEPIKIPSIERKVLEQFRKSISKRAAAVPTEVPVDDHTNAFLGKGEKENSPLNGLHDYLKTQNPGAPGAGVIVDFNGTTGKVTELINEEKVKYLKYNLEYYNTPTYVGTSQRPGDMGTAQDATILRFSRPDMDKGEIKKYIWTNNKDKYDKVEDVPDSEVTNFENDNPLNLYLSMEGTSYNTDIPGAAKETFTDFGQAALDSQDSYSFEKLLNSYVNIDVISDSKRRELYNAMNARIYNMWDKKLENDVVRQPPAHWHDNKNGTHSGYQIEYVYKDGAIRANVSLITMNNNVDYSQPDNVPSIVPQYTIPLGVVNNNTLRRLDILHGTGREEDIIQNPRTGTAFVPNFISPQTTAGIK